MTSATIALFVFAFVLYIAGYLGDRYGLFSYKMFLFAFAIPAGFFLAWGMVKALAPDLNIWRQISIPAGLSILTVILSLLFLRFTKVE